MRWTLPLLAVACTGTTEADFSKVWGVGSTEVSLDSTTPEWQATVMLELPPAYLSALASDATLLAFDGSGTQSPAGDPGVAVVEPLGVEVTADGTTVQLTGESADLHSCTGDGMCDVGTVHLALDGADTVELTLQVEASIRLPPDASNLEVPLTFSSD